MPQASMYALVTAMRARLPHTARTVGYGHIGDGNLHLNIVVPYDIAKHMDPSLLALIEPFVYEWTRDVRGSISAEHGIGQMKTGAIKYSKDEVSLTLMRNLKSLLDPVGILNPYKTLPPPA
jgi:D-2-hydroxyglutarate dehydrogenase